MAERTGALPSFLPPATQDRHPCLYDFRDEDPQQVLDKRGGHGHIVALELVRQVLHVKQGLLCLPPPAALPARGRQTRQNRQWCSLGLVVSRCRVQDEGRRHGKGQGPEQLSTAVEQCYVGVWLAG